MKKESDINFLGIRVFSRDDLINKYHYLYDLGYQINSTNGVSIDWLSVLLNIYDKCDDVDSIYISLYSNRIVVGGNNSNDILVDISEFKECKGYDLEDNRRYYSDVIGSYLTIKNLGL